jgi:hypothetical protein
MCVVISAIWVKRTQINLESKRKTLTSRRAAHPLRQSRLMFSSAAGQRMSPELHQKKECDQHHCHVGRWDSTPLYRLIHCRGFYDIIQKGLRG